MIQTIDMRLKNVRKSILAALYAFLSIVLGRKTVPDSLLVRRYPMKTPHVTNSLNGGVISDMKSGS